MAYVYKGNHAGLDSFDATPDVPTRVYQPRQEKSLRPCGTRAALRRHQARNETPCGPCEQAGRDYDNQRYTTRKKKVTA